jgi:hypothetical protein
LRVLLLALDESLYELHLLLSSCARRSAALSTNQQSPKAERGNGDPVGRQP